MRFVLDTNVVISALVWGGVPYKLIEAAVAGDIELVSSPALLAELRDVLGLGNHQGIAIVRAADALRRVEDARGTT